MKYFITALIVGMSIFILWELSKEIEKVKLSEYERGALFAVDWNYKYHDYPSYWARRHHYYNPKLSVDSIRYLQDSISNNRQENTEWVSGLDSSYYVVGISEGRIDTIYGIGIQIPAIDSTRYKFISNGRYFDSVTTKP